jgi:AraC-like DNA-binding protein
MNGLIAKQIAERLGITEDSVLDAFREMLKTERCDIILEYPSEIPYMLMGWIMAEMHYETGGRLKIG